MKMHLQYLWYVIRHKFFVFQAGLKTEVPIWRLLIHDWSKFSRTEWGPYARRFYGGSAGKLDKSKDPEEFHVAWTHHWHKNPHHWEHWLRSAKRQPIETNSWLLMEPMRMPTTYVREMVADWMGAGRAITGTWEAADWYLENRERIVLHEESRRLAERLLGVYGA